MAQRRSLSSFHGTSAPGFAARVSGVCFDRKDALSASLPTSLAEPVGSTTSAPAESRNVRKIDIPARLSKAVALAHWTGRTNEVEVPQALAQLHAVFWLHPTPITALCFILGLVAFRCGSGPAEALECVACALGVAIWIIQEWAIHKKLFHGNLEWFGKTIHIDHHQTPYYHISIDDPFIALGVMLLSTVVFVCAFGTLGVAADIGYIIAGLVYQFTHYGVHCRYVPSSKLARSIRAHHMQHHCRNENYWLSFTLPQVDTWMNTNPSPSSVPMTDMAKEAVRNRT
eukprot:jgi/Ulvmu1/7617/UM038_0042.1